MRFRSKSEAFFFYLCMVLVAMLVMVQPVRAETIPATQEKVYSPYGSPTESFETAESACAAANDFNAGFYYSHIEPLEPNWTSGGNGAIVAGCYGRYVVTNQTAWARYITRWLVLSCPKNQNWTKSGSNCVRPDCTATQERDPSDGICKDKVAECPTQVGTDEPLYLGYRVMTIPPGVDPDAELADACDPAYCAVGVTVIGHIFGVGLIRTLPLPRKCPDSPSFVPTPSAVLTVTFKNLSDPKKTDFDKVVADAAKVDAAKVEAEKEVLDRLKTQLDAANTAIAEKQASFETAVSEQAQSAKNLTDAANRYMLNSTPENLAAFEAAKADYASKSAAARYKLTQAQDARKIATGIRQTVPLLEDSGKQQITIRQGLDVDISTSQGSSPGATYDPTKVEAHTGDTGGLGVKLTDADTANAGLKGSIDGLNTKIGELTTQMNGLGQAVQGAIDGMADAGVPDDGTVDTTPEEPPTPDFCAENPTDPSCQTKAPIKGGALPTFNGSWYEKKYPDGIGTVLTDNMAAMKATPLFSVINDIVPTISGGAHTGCFTIEIWKVGAQQLCIPQIVMQALGVFMLLTAVFSARAIIFGG